MADNQEFFRDSFLSGLFYYIASEKYEAIAIITLTIFSQHNDDFRVREFSTLNSQMEVLCWNKQQKRQL